MFLTSFVLVLVLVLGFAPLYWQTLTHSKDSRRAVWFPRFRFHTDSCTWRRPRQFVARVHIATRRDSFAFGAGYVGGATAYLGVNVIRPHVDRYHTRRLVIG